MAVAVGAVVFMQSLVATSDAQSVRVAERLLEKMPVEADALVARMQLDFRPEGRVLQGPPMMAVAATSSQRGIRRGECGEMLTLHSVSLDKTAYRIQMNGKTITVPIRTAENLWVRRPENLSQ